jgi:curved DNA-binding protein CbpA
MGNDNSKSTIENQQMILQLQQQILNNQLNQHKYPQKHFNPNGNSNINTNTFDRPKISNISVGEYYDRSLPVLSPAEIQQSNIHPHSSMMHDISKNTNSKPKTLFDILNNKKMMEEVDKNPATKRKLLERLLNEHRHIMTASQVKRITHMLDTLPPADNLSLPAFVPINSYENDNCALRGGFNQGTTNQEPEGKQLQRTQQLNTIEALTKHYKTEADREEAEFKIEEERRRKEFLEKQRHRRMNYQSKLSELDKNNIDALKIFQLSANYTLDELKQAYKKMAMKTHPDKPGGNADQFQLITKCYMSLLEKYKNRESERQFGDLKKGSQSYLEDQQNSRMVNKKMVAGTVDKDKFDAKLFNKIYEQNKLWESSDDGYGSWFSSSDTNEPPTEVFGNKFNLNVFNSTFEDYKGKLTTQNGAIQEYHEPQELVSCATGFTDIDIYARKIDDFSKPLPISGAGGSKSSRDLAYTDLKTAYTGRGAFIDPNKVEYKTYNSVDELKRDRGNIRFDMTPEQMREYEMKKYREQEEEEKRRELIRQRDNMITNSYGKIHQKMLGYRGNAPS